MSDKPTDEQPAFFVSRRGRHVGLHELDMSGMDIDSDTKSAVKTNAAGGEKPRRMVTKTKPADVIKTKPARRGRRWSRRGAIIAAVIVLLVMALPVLGGEAVAGQYRQGVSTARRDLAKIVETSVLPAQKKTTISADQLRDIADKVNDIVGNMCRGGLLDNAAGVYPRANAALKDCKAAQAKYSALGGSLYEMEGETRYLERLEGCIKPVTTPITDAYAVLGAQQELWGAASSCVEKLSPPNQMRAAHNALAEHASKVHEAWSKLSTANNDQDVAGFTAAEKTLASEYEAVRSSAATFTAALQASQASLSAAYADLK